jgi:hypothetical protein
MYDIDGYEFVRHDRTETRGGGVAFYIKKGLKYDIVCKSKNGDNEGAEYLIISIQLLEVKMLACVLYRRPQNNIKLNTFFADLQEHYPHYDQCVVMGDFNCNFKKDSVLLRSLNFEIDELGLERLPLEDTHISNNAVTTIDAIFVSPECEPLCYGKFENFLSHHAILYAILNCGSGNIGPEWKTIREFDKIDKELLEQEALKINWADRDHIPIEERVANFNAKLHFLFDKIAPKKNIKIATKFKPKLPLDIKMKTRERNAAKKYALRVKSIDSFNIFKMLRNKVKQLILNFHKSIIFNKLQELSNTKHIWCKLRHLGLIKDKKRAVLR